MTSLIPLPASFEFRAESFSLFNATKICTPDTPETIALGKLLAKYIEAHTQLRLSVVEKYQNLGNIHLMLKDNASLGEEGYELVIDSYGVRLWANRPAGLFYGIQTLRQLLVTPQTPPSLPAVSITDSPRFTWRGAMLDVARHFFGIEDVKRYIDLISHYKMNRLHLHLTDDQGWRIEIKSWPRLTELGGRTQVGGGGGGFYTQEQYKEIVEYAASRYVMIIPEIDTPGHTNAALASYAELNASEEAPALYEGSEVGFSTLNIKSEITYQFLDDVIRELAAISPAPYIHIGGDEARSTPEEQYKYFIKRFQEIVYSHNRIPIGWSEIGEAELNPNTLTQHWHGGGYQGAKEQGCKFILSPATKTYLDMKYHADCPLGLDWAGLVSVKDSYEWEPASFIEGIEESDIIGIEAPLWTETILTMKDIEFMTFPRLPGLAEHAWSPKGLPWEEYKQRLAKHGKHLEKLKINFFRSSDIDWK